MQRGSIPVVATAQQGRSSSGLLLHPRGRRQAFRLTRDYLVQLEREAARRYDRASRARLLADLRSDCSDFDQREDDRLTLELARAARRWERTLVALERPLPPGLIAIMTRLAPPLR